ncbi:MAG TPA: DUF2779 domain-containing protein [Candidatus Paceibacterota bacterium]|nr:DUF2779 domain-containing protein [Candidatus Paceibacterota bacterium]
MITLTKTDFKEYLICPKWLWVKKKKPELYVEGEMSLFLEKLIKDGYEVEGYAQKLFPDGVEVTGDKATLIAKTNDLLQEHKTMFQATFQTEKGLFAKVDILAFNNETQKWDLYEIKASSEIKTDLQHNHLKDITFQTITVEESGVDVGSSYIVHINKEYRRNGDINPSELFIIEDVTDKVQADKENVRLEINEAISLLSKEEVSFDGCECLYRSHGQRCDSFELFNPKVPKYSVHHIVTGKKLQSLLDDNILDVKDIPDDFDLTDIQRGKVVLQKSGKPLIDTDSIRETLSNLTFPLYFLDYETFGKPYPVLDGYKTNQQIVFQVSIHIVQENGDIEHCEYLGNDFETSTTGLLEMMREKISPTGSVIVWNEGFEKGRNKELAEIHPEYADFLEDINRRVYDLMLVFKKDYLHPDCFGSASIKKVLPVLLPELSYKNLEIQDGTMALSEWERSTTDSVSPAERESIRENLLKYCELDTLAMVEIWKVLRKVVD